jgi:NAD-dependent DNA ligase
VKGKKESIDLKAGEKVKLEGIAVGDKVLVSHKGDIASSVKKVTAKKAAKKKAPLTAAPISPSTMKEMKAPPAAPPAAPAEKK